MKSRVFSLLALIVALTVPAIAQLSPKIAILPPVMAEAGLKKTVFADDQLSQTLDDFARIMLEQDEFQLIPLAKTDSVAKGLCLFHALKDSPSLDKIVEFGVKTGADFVLVHSYTWGCVYVPESDTVRGGSDRRRRPGSKGYGARWKATCTTVLEIVDVKTRQAIFQSKPIVVSTRSTGSSFHPGRDISFDEPGTKQWAQQSSALDGLNDGLKGYRNARQKASKIPGPTGK